MASRLETKELKKLIGMEVVVFLRKIKFQKVTEILLSGDFGEVTGELLDMLDEESLQDGLEITNSFVRKRFMTTLTKYKNEGVPIDMINSIPAQYLEIALPKKINERSKLNLLLKESTKITHACTNEMDVYEFPVKRILVSELKEPAYGQNLKKIILMGETGSGKSTLLNAIVNYAAGVEIEDPFRFQLVVDEAEQAADQSNSQTTEVSGYLIQNTELDFAIQIWDTPGFGDTRGVERDEEIKQQINELLKVEDFCHAICFVVKGTVNRLTCTQKYIIDSVLQFFGEEAQENIFLLATYADDDIPSVLDVFKKSNFPFDENRCFQFNNAALFKPASERTIVSKCYWKIVNDSFNKLFFTIGEVRPFSLNSTKDAIEEKHDFQLSIDTISERVRGASFIINSWDECLDDLNLQAEQVKRTGKFKDTEPREIKLEVVTTNSNTICKSCHSNCHIGCSKPGVFFCDKLNWKWTCKICLCNYSDHYKQKYIYKVITEKVEVTKYLPQDESNSVFEFAKTCEEKKAKAEREKFQEQEKIDGLFDRILKTMKFVKQNHKPNSKWVKHFTTVLEKKKDFKNADNKNEKIYTTISNKPNQSISSTQCEIDENVEESQQENL